MHFHADVVRQTSKRSITELLEQKTKVPPDPGYPFAAGPLPPLGQGGPVKCDQSRTATASR